LHSSIDRKKKRTDRPTDRYRPPDQTTERPTDPSIPMVSGAPRRRSSSGSWPSWPCARPSASPSRAGAYAGLSVRLPGGFPETVANAAVCNRQLNAAVCIFDTMSDEAGLGGRTQSPFVSVAFCRSHFFRPCDVGSFLFPSISLRSTKKWKPGKCDT